MLHIKKLNLDEIREIYNACFETLLKQDRKRF